MDHNSPWLASRDRCRANLLGYSEAALQALPPLDKTRILDAGCGTGVPTRFLAAKTGGEIWAVDADSRAIRYLEASIRGTPLAGRVHPACSVIPWDDDRQPGLPASFDVIWTEGILNAIGPDLGLRFFLTRLAGAGCIVIHDGAREVAVVLQLAGELGLHVRATVEVPAAAWVTAYFEPLMATINDLGPQALEDPDLAREWRQARDALANPAGLKSSFLVLDRA